MLSKNYVLNMLSRKVILFINFFVIVIEDLIMRSSGYSKIVVLALETI